MIIHIEKCFETSIGVVIVFGTPSNFVPHVGMQLENEINDLWQIKAISFTEQTNNLEREKMEGSKSKVYRGYQVLPITNIRSDTISLNDYFINNKWNLID